MKLKIIGALMAGNLLALLLATPLTSSAGNLFVANSGYHSFNSTIEEFDSAGVGTVFAGYPQANGATGLAFDNAGNLYVADNGDGTIRKFNSSGVGTVVASGVYNPWSLACDNMGNLCVSISGNTIEKFNSSGVGTSFAYLGANSLYAYLAFDSAGNLYVANQNNNIIQKFDSSGIGTVFASSGLSYPSGLAFDSAGYLYVANTGTGTIEKFDSSGVGTLFASSGLSYPTGLAFDTAGNLYAANYYNNTIEEFNSSGVGTVFASSGLDDPMAIAFQPVPEPTTLALLATGVGTLFGTCRLRARGRKPVHT